MPDDPFQSFFGTLAKATNETQKREAFVILAATGFRDSTLATSLALGAEYQVRFEQAGLIRRGVVDCFYGNLVIEFENRLSSTKAHALDQLRGYVAGAWNEAGGRDRPYLAVASDGDNWEVYVPSRPKECDYPFSAESVTLTLLETYCVVADDGAALPSFLNRLLFREFLLVPTTRNFVADFGLGSPAFRWASEELASKLSELAGDSQLGILRQTWADSLTIAYGGEIASDDLFVRHTYLAVLARLLIWAALERRPLRHHELDAVLNGDYFRGRNIANLVEDDFFTWHTIPTATDAARTWIALSHQLVGYDLSTVEEDILKPLYEELVDPETRHDLGEFYTPDWLASRVVGHLLGSWDWSEGFPRILDPACGSGTFLRAALHHLRALSDLEGDALLTRLLDSVMGIDVHPLAVIISRATYVLAVSDLISSTKHQTTLPVFLANSLSQEGLVEELTLFGDDRAIVAIGSRHFHLPTPFLHSGHRFDDAIDEVLEVARSYAGSDSPSEDAIASVHASLSGRLDDFPGIYDELGNIAAYLVDLIRDRRDSVYGFLLRNHYRPAMLHQQFDFVVGNPPWLTIGDIDNASYKDMLLGLVRRSRIAPRSAGEQAHTELATLFLPQASRMYLCQAAQYRPTPSIALVLPRSVFTASHHRYLREGTYTAAFVTTQLWDLLDVEPLFNIPSCVLFARASPPLAEAPPAIDGLVFSGHLKAREIPIAVAADVVREDACGFELAYLGKRSAWRRSGDTPNRDTVPQRSSNAYTERFRQGAIIYPQTLFVVVGDEELHRGPGTVRVRTNPIAASKAKLCRDIAVDHIVERASLFSTAVAEHILVFAHARPLWSLLLPATTEPTSDKFAVEDSRALRRAGRVRTATWLDWAERQWEVARKKGETSSLVERLDYLGQLSKQAGQLRWLVVFAASASRPFASVIDGSLGLPFVARDGTYWASFSTVEEASYVACFLNSDLVADSIRDWMNQGLFGPRHVHKRVLDVPFPLFDPSITEHARLATVGIELLDEATVLLKDLPSVEVGRRRSLLRSRLSAESMNELEALVLQLSSGG